MDSFTRDTRTRGNGYVPAPADRSAPKRIRRSFPTWFRTAGRVRYLVATTIIALGALTVPVLVHALTAPRSSVLSAARDLPAGHVITEDDLKSVPVSGPATAVIPASRAASLIGQQVRADVPSGALLAPGNLGSYPPAGMTLVPVAVKPGQYPPNLASGYEVAVFPLGPSTGGAVQEAAHAAATGRVVQIQAQPDSSNGAVVVLLATSTAQAAVIAQSPGAVLVTLDSAGDVP